MSTYDLNTISSKISELEKRFHRLLATVEERKRQKETLERKCTEYGIDYSSLESEIKSLTDQRNICIEKINDLIQSLESEIKAYENY